MHSKKEPAPLYPHASKAARELLRYIQEEEVSLDAARSRILEELRALLDLDPHLIDFALRQTSEQTTKPGLVKVLRDFVSFLSSQKASTAIYPGSFLSRIVGLEERVLSNTVSLAVLTDLLVEKRVVSREELLERITARRDSFADTS